MRILILILFSLSFFRVSSQSDLEIQDSISNEEIYLFLKDSCDNAVSLGCGYGGVESQNMTCFKILIKNKRFDLIEKLIDSKVNASKYLAVETLLLAEAKTLYTIDEELKKKIKRIKKSNSLVMVCDGCDGYLKYSVSFFFEKNDDFGHYIRLDLEKIFGDLK